MRTRHHRFSLLVVGALALVAVACSGGGGETAKPEEQQPITAPAVEPPGDQDLDVEPGTVTAGSALSSSTALGDDKLPPQIFGTITADANFKLDDVEASPVELSVVKFFKDSENYVSFRRDRNNNVVWKRHAPNNVVVELTAYVPADHGDDCHLMSENLADFFKSGNTIEYAAVGSSSLSSATFQKSGTGENEKTPKVKATIKLAAGTACAPSS